MKKRTIKILGIILIFQLKSLAFSQTPESKSDEAKPTIITYILRHQNALRITQDQLEKLKSEAGKIKDLQKKLSIQTFQKKQDFYIRLILNKDQYRYLLINYNRSLTLSHSVDEWKQLCEFKLNNGLDSIEIVDKFNQFENDKLAAIAESRYVEPKDSLNVINTAIFLKPFLLWKLEAYSGNIRTSQFIYAIKNRGQINLTGKQIDSLLNHHIELEKKRYNFAKRYPSLPYSSIEFEREKIFKVLSSAQYSTFLTIKNEKLSQLNAEKDWERLKNAKLITRNTDSTKISDENSAYELNLLIAKESMALNRASIKEITAKKPMLLKELDRLNTIAAENKHVKQSFAW